MGAHCPIFPISPYGQIPILGQNIESKNRPTPYRFTPSHHTLSQHIGNVSNFTYENWNKRRKPPSFSFSPSFFFQTLKSCFFQHFQLSKRQTQRVEEESSSTQWYRKFKKVQAKKLVKLHFW